MNFGMEKLAIFWMVFTHVSLLKWCSFNRCLWMTLWTVFTDNNLWRHSWAQAVVFFVFIFFGTFQILSDIVNMQRSKEEDVSHNLSTSAKLHLQTVAERWQFTTQQNIKPTRSKSLFDQVWGNLFFTILLLTLDCNLQIAVVDEHDVFSSDC